MLTVEGCRQRRLNLFAKLQQKMDTLVLADPIHLRYFANFSVDPFSSAADFGGLLILRADGTATLYYDNRLPKNIAGAFAEEKHVVSWYDGQTPGKGPRRTVLADVLSSHGGRIHDAINDPMGKEIQNIIAELRRQKLPDEIMLMKRCMRATEAGHAWARENIQADLTELQMYTGVFQACVLALGEAGIVYGDFAVSPGASKRGGAPTLNKLKNGDMFILDYSVVVNGYRSDFTNTLVVGKNPTPDQIRLYDACRQAMANGENELRAGIPCQQVFDAVNSAFVEAGLADHFGHHAGHGLGLGHPEDPFLVKHSNQTLLEGDVVTLEPGLYIDGIGGIRIENNYLITEKGFETLSNHQIALI